MAQIKVIIKDIENSNFSRACLNELKRESNPEPFNKPIRYYQSY